MNIAGLPPFELGGVSPLPYTAVLRERFHPFWTLRLSSAQSRFNESGLDCQWLTSI